MNKEIINYIEKRLLEQPYEGTWITLDGKEKNTDLGYVLEWWNNCMKPELEEIFSAE